MDDLKNSTFFDGRLLPLIGRIVSYQKPSAISGDELELVERADEIQALNEALLKRKNRKSLVSFLQQVKEYAPVADAVFFLIETQKEDRLGEGVEALELVVEEKKLVDGPMLATILKLGDTMPLMFAVPLVGGNGEKRYKPKAPRSSSIDLDKLRSFK